MSNKNIILIGMPGSGKTTIGKILAKKLNKKFCDIDEYIEETQDKKISDIFKDGENVFRKIEMDAVAKISKKQNIIISTGGGIVKFPQNIYQLKKNGIIIFIDRPLEDIINDVNISTRPLLKDGIEKIFLLHKERYILYRGYADYIVANTSDMDNVVEDIIDLIDKHFNGSEGIETNSN